VSTTTILSVPTLSVAPKTSSSTTTGTSTGSGPASASSDHARPQQPTANPSSTPHVAPLPPINAPALLQCAPFLARHADFAVAPNAAAALHTDATARVHASQIGRATNVFASVHFPMSTHRTNDIVSGEIRQSGIWEPWTLAVLSAALDTMALVAPAAASSAAHRIDFIDIGANVGMLSCSAARF
jgi:hypothetical protein